MDIADGHNSSPEMLAFEIQHQASRMSPRAGKFVQRGRYGVATPWFVASASRGVVPHITPDLVQKHTSISVVYTGLEDFLERSRYEAPILHVPPESAAHGSTLRSYTGLPDTCMSILGPRRVPRLETRQQNSNDALSISTSFGFASLKVTDYDKATRKLRPDVSITAVDLILLETISQKRKERVADRTHAWLRDLLEEVERDTISVPLFASIPPLEPEQQSFYLSDLSEEYKHQLSGICVYERATIAAVPEGLGNLPVLFLGDPQGPHDLLNAISLGADLITVPFVTTASEAGIALTFTFTPSKNDRNQPLGVDMWSSLHATDLSPLAEYCSCYACLRHHKAFLHHLLQAKEMLAWTLLQIHNFRMVSQFCEQVRESILQGSFDEDSRIFRETYEMDIPQQTGQGPRLRGYQVSSLGPGELPKNSKAYNKFDDQGLKIEEAESGIATPDDGEDAGSLEDHGLGKKVE